MNEQIKPPVAVVEKPVESASSRAAGINTGIIAIENIRTRQSSRGDSFVLSLDLVKLNVSNTKLSGYVYLLWKVSDRYQTLPESEEIKNGMPADFKEGDTFDIRYRKPISWKIKTRESDIQSLSLLVFDTVGKIILKEDITRKALELDR